jgi:hypothetical protein
MFHFSCRENLEAPIAAIPDDEEKLIVSFA